MPEDSLFGEQRSVFTAFAARRIPTCSHEKLLLSFLEQVTSERHMKILKKASDSYGIFKMPIPGKYIEGEKEIIVLLLHFFKNLPNMPDLLTLCCARQKKILKRRKILTKLSNSVLKSDWLTEQIYVPVCLNCIWFSADKKMPLTSIHNRSSWYFSS